MVEPDYDYGTTTKYKKLDKIGEGAQAVIFLVERISDRKKFIAKINKD